MRLSTCTHVIRSTNAIDRRYSVSLIYTLRLDEVLHKRFSALSPFNLIKYLSFSCYQVSVSEGHLILKLIQYFVDQVPQIIDVKVETAQPTERDKYFAQF